MSIKLCRASAARAPFSCVASTRSHPSKLAAASSKSDAQKLGSCSMAPAPAAEKIGSFPAAGFFFKDAVDVIAIDDPAVSGVTLFISDFERSLPDKIAKMGSEPSSASVACAQTGTIKILDEAKVKAKGGDEVFSEKKGLNFFQNKTLRVRRLFDEKHRTLLYIAYSTRLQSDKEESPGRFKTSVCALPISSEVAPVEQTEANKDSGLFTPAQNTS